MKNITPQEPIKLSDSLTLTFKQFVVDNLLMDAQFGKDFDSLSKANDIKQAFNNNPIQLSDEAHELLCQVVKNPSNGYQPKLALPVIPFMLAILNAQ